jgi:hypothetical protein
VTGFSAAKDVATSTELAARMLKIRVDMELVYKKTVD